MLQKQHVRWRIGAYSFILLSFFLRVFQLNDIAVEKAEMMSIVWFIRRGLAFLLTDNKALNNHPLNSLLAYLTSMDNESIFTYRWHSVLIGVITVAVVFRLVREMFSARDGFVAGLLISTSAYHVTLSQRSRGYVGLVGFTVLGFYFAYRAVQTGQKRYWLGFVVASILDIYSHLYGVMAVGAVGLVILIPLLRRITLRQPLKKAVFPALSPLILSLFIAYLISFGLYLPMLPSTLSVAGQNNQFRESDLRQTSGYTTFQEVAQPLRDAIRPFSLAEDSTRLRLGDPAFHYSPVDGVAALAEGSLGFYLSLGSFLLGLLFSWRRFRVQAFICVAWLALPFILQQVGNIILPGAYFRGRFLAFIYPPYLLLMARGWPGLADWLAARVGDRSSLKLLAGSAGWLGVGGLTVLNLAWLGAYYSAAINEHWNDVARSISQNMQSNDVVMCGQRPKTACNFDLSARTRTEVQEFSELITFENIRANRSHVEQSGRVWVVMPHLTPWQIADLQEKIKPTNYWLAGNPRYDQAGWILVDSQQTLGDNLIAALQLGIDISLDREEKYRNYISLAQIHLARNQLTAAEKALISASELLPDDIGSRQRFDFVVEQLQYARQAARPVEDLPPTAVQVNLNFGGMARLIAYEVDHQTISPGEALRVRLYWQPLARMEQSFASFVHLTDHEANLLGEDSGIPAAGGNPTTAWEPGQIVVDPHTVSVDATTQAPLVMSIEAGLFDPQNYEFIKAVDDIGQPTNSMIAEMKVLPSVWPSASPTFPLNANFDGLISLTGYDLASDPPGIALYWQAQAAMNEDYTVFIHLVDANGQLVAQMDGQPFQGRYPTSWWSPGELIIDRRSAPAIAPGKYRLLVGWYRLSDGARLPLTDGGGDSVTLGIVNLP
jgi:hypothetical protein